MFDGYIHDFLIAGICGVFYSRMRRRYPIVHQKWWHLAAFFFSCVTVSFGLSQLYRYIITHNQAINAIIHIPVVKYDIITIYCLCLVRFLFYRRQSLVLYLMDACLAVIYVMIWLD